MLLKKKKTIFPRLTVGIRCAYRYISLRSFASLFFFPSDTRSYEMYILFFSAFYVHIFRVNVSFNAC